MKRKFYYIIVLIACLIFSCEEDPEIHSFDIAPIQISLRININSVPFILNQPNFSDQMDRTYQVELLKFYLSNCFIEKNDGSLVGLADVCLFDYAKDSILVINSFVDTGAYKQLHFGIGLDSNLNSSDPSNFLSSHPLSIAQNTYWTWANKYKFFMLEGRVALLGENIPSKIFSYHSGLDTLYRQISLPLEEFYIQSDGANISLKLDLEKVINGSAGNIDLVEESFSHSIENFHIVETLSDNLLTAFSITN
tara:strand:+ start:1356 stop:2108 length:753 start_codon:yes stop_codon:yes gene_type:complete